MTTPHDTRKLLELAAKAAGLSVKIWDGHTGPMCAIDDDHHGTMWMPHHDDGDALRLAVALKINVQHDDESPVVWVYYTRPGRFSSDRDCEEYGDDPLAATRMAVLRAAAAIGEAMP